MSATGNLLNCGCLRQLLTLSLPWKYSNLLLHLVTFLQSTNIFFKTTLVYTTLHTMIKHIMRKVWNDAITWKMMLKSAKKKSVNKSQTLIVQNSNNALLYSLKVPDWVEHRKLAGVRKPPFLIAASTFHAHNTITLQRERVEESCSLQMGPMWGVELYFIVWAKLAKLLSIHGKARHVVWCQYLAKRHSNSHSHYRHLILAWLK